MPTISEIEKFFEQKISYKNKITIEDIKRDFQNITFVNVENKQNKNKNSKKKQYSKKCKLKVIFIKQQYIHITGFYTKEINIRVKTQLTNIHSALHLVRDNYTHSFATKALNKIIKKIQQTKKLQRKTKHEFGCILIIK